MKLLIIDNYDSFTYNLVQMINQTGLCTTEVRRNDQFTLEEIAQYDKILISPGPGIPTNAGLTKQVIENYAPQKSILGVCLGHQAIGEVYGNTLENLHEVKHGVATSITLDSSDYLFNGISKEIQVGRYHSWVISREQEIQHLEIIAQDAEGQIMAVKHSTYDLRGVQFHPESILTPDGAQIIQNFLEHKNL